LAEPTAAEVVYLLALPGREASALALDPIELKIGEGVHRVVSLRPASEEPLTLGILLDASGSMSDVLAEATVPCRTFLEKTIRPEDRYFVGVVNTQLRISQPLTSDTSRFVEAVPATDRVGDTALYDAIATLLDELRRRPGRRALIVYSDGFDTSSAISYPVLLASARSTGIPIYALGARLSAGTTNRDQLRMERLAKESGGLFLGGVAPGAAASAFERVDSDLQSHFYAAVAAEATDVPSAACAVVSEARARRSQKPRCLGRLSP
jgi:VWFA-related protein